MSPRKEVRDLVRRLGQIPGVAVRLGGGGHYIVTLDGAMVSTIPSTPGDWRWMRNLKSQLRKKGIELEQKAVKRDAGGESPPPLPDMKELSKMAFVNHVTGADARALVESADKLVTEVGEYFDLKTRRGRVTPHGFVPEITKIALAYHQQTGAKIPHMEYKKRDVSDDREMCRLAAEKVSDVVGGNTNRDKLTLITVEQIGFLVDAWEWSKTKPEAIVPRGEMRLEQLPVSYQPASVDPDLAEGPAEDHSEEAPVTTNGVLDADTTLVLRLVAKLAYAGVIEEEAVLMGTEVYAAIRR